MTEQQSITFKIHDDTLQKSCAITVNVGDKYEVESPRGFVWECVSIGFGHITFIQDINIEYDYFIPACERRKPFCILSFEQAKRVLQCPVYNWTKTNEPTRTIKY
jgi:hypothetical protein